MSQATPAQGTTQQPTPVCLLLKFNSGQQPLQAGVLGLRVPSSWPLNQGWWPLPRWPAQRWQLWAWHPAATRPICGFTLGILPERAGQSSVTFTNK